MKVLRASWIDATTSLKLSPIRTISALSIATSVPELRAIPTSAWDKAGASLIPSPTIATTQELSPTFKLPCWRERISPAFCSGVTPAITLVLSRPSCWAITTAASNLSPLSTITCKPILCKWFTVNLASGLMVSLTAIKPAKMSSTATPMTVFPSFASFCPCSWVVVLIVIP